MRRTIAADNRQEQELLKQLGAKNDIKSERIKRLLALPDLTKKDRSPIKIIADTIVNLPRFTDFDVVEFPKIVKVEENFDLLNTSADHPSRRETDTYYVDSDHVLRTQMTDMWPYYLREKSVLEQLEKEGKVACLAAGIVFRKDEIDKKHFPAFHQIDFLYIAKKEKEVITVKDLEDVQADAVRSIFGPDIEFRFLVDSFPFTDPSIQIEIKWPASQQGGGNDWLEITGAGLVHQQVLKNFGIDPEVYNGWAFAFGIERLAMIKMGIPDIRVFWSDDTRITNQFSDINSTYKEVSKYPAVERDISFIIDKKVALNNYYEIVRDIGGALIEEVKLTDEYENDEKFGADKKSYTFHIVYRSLERTLTNEEVNVIHDKITEKTKSEFNAIIR